MDFAIWQPKKVASLNQEEHGKNDPFEFKNFLGYES